jgi:hypothetical protein
MNAKQGRPISPEDFMGRPSHRLDVTARIVAWLEKHTPAPNA